MRLSIIAGLILIAGIMGLGFMHEQVHVAIYEGYGIDSHIEYFSHFPDLVTIADEPCEYESCVLAHDINEAIGYPLMVFYAVFGLFFMMIIILLEALVEIKLSEVEND